MTGRVADAGHSRQRAVLAVLLLELGRVVPTELLIDRVWGEEPPASGRNVLYGYVARLRAVIASAADPEVALARCPGGYLLQARAEQLDLCRFRRLIAEAAAAGDGERAAALLRAALELWRGPPLAGLDSPWLRRMRDTLEGERFAAVLDLNDIRLRHGEHGALAGELAGQAATCPADERLIGQLMLALYRSGRPAEALRWFENARQHLADELGAHPGPGLQALHQQILRADPSLAVPAPGSLATPVPRQLPADVPAFTGRAGELAALTGLLDQVGQEAPGTMVISAIGGTAGVGKTALAVHWAQQVAERFPDGQLYVNLRGYDPGQPMPAADALAGFLRALGVPGQDIPPEEDERAARYRSLLAGRRMLIVADNAGSVEQVRPLMPATPACVAVVTSRDALAGLVARDGARRLDLDLLPLADALGLLQALIGGRVDADPGAAAALAEHCSRLPLALRVAAELAADRPAVSLAGLASELADQRRRLDLLEAGGDQRTAVRAVFSWSYRHLDAAAASTFRLLSLYLGPDFDPYAAAALTEATVEQAERLLDLLARAHLIQPAGSGRYSVHDLLRAYSRELGAAQDGEHVRRSALTRLLDHYLHTAATAMALLFPVEHRRPGNPRSAVQAPPMTDPATARAWLDTQRANLVAAAYAAEHGWPGHTTRLAVTLFRYLQTGGYFSEAITIHTCARRAACHAGDRTAEATALTSLGTVDMRQGRYQQATGCLQQALAVFRETGDRFGEARALNNLALVDFDQGHYQRATDHLQQALALFRDAGDRLAEARALGNLGLIDERMGRLKQARDHHRQALTLNRETGYRPGEAANLGNLGHIYLRQGSYPQAADHHRQALALFRDTGYRVGEAEALTSLGLVELRQASYPQAADYLRQGLALSREMGDRSAEANALNGLGEMFLATGQPELAYAQHATSLGLASQIGEKYEQARACNGLGHACLASGDPGQARHHWREALALYTVLAVPEADQVRAQLTASNSQRGLEQ